MLKSLHLGLACCRSAAPSAIEVLNGWLCDHLMPLPLICADNHGCKNSTLGAEASILDLRCDCGGISNPRSCMLAKPICRRPILWHSWVPACNLYGTSQLLQLSLADYWGFTPHLRPWHVQRLALDLRPSSEVQDSYRFCRWIRGQIWGGQDQVYCRLRISTLQGVCVWPQHAVAHTEQKILQWDIWRLGT